MPTTGDRPYRVWLYRGYTEVRLDGRWRLVHLDLDPRTDQTETKARLLRLYTALTDADQGSRWDKDKSQLLLTDTPDGVEPAGHNSFWWAPDPKDQR